MGRLSDAALGGTLFDSALQSLPKPLPRKAFDGETYDSSRDYLRLDCQLGRVFHLMKDGQWRSLSEIGKDVDGSEAAISARLRDLRKDKYGGHSVERQHIERGLYRYRLLVAK